MEEQFDKIATRLTVLNFLLLQQPFVLLKLMGLIDLGWVLVFMPTIIMGGTVVIGVILLLIVAAFSTKNVESEQ